MLCICLQCFLFHFCCFCLFVFVCVVHARGPACLFRVSLLHHFVWWCLCIWTKHSFFCYYVFGLESHRLPSVRIVPCHQIPHWTRSYWCRHWPGRVFSQLWKFTARNCKLQYLGKYKISNNLILWDLLKTVQFLRIFKHFESTLIPCT